MTDNLQKNVRESISIILFLKTEMIRLRIELLYPH